MKDYKGFISVELSILIVIISLVLLVILGAYLSARVSARDEQRVVDVAAMQKALQAYFTENGFYPSGSSTLLPVGIGSYVDRWPTASSPDGNCTDLQNSYLYSQRSDGSDYSLSFCLGHKAKSISSGAHTLTSKGIQ